MFDKGDKVKCIDFRGLTKEVKDWLNLIEVHEVAMERNKKYVPIVHLMPANGVKAPRLSDMPYPFFSDRFIKV